MRILFVDDTFPGHFRHLPAFLAADPANEVRFASQWVKAPEVPGVRLVSIPLVGEPSSDTHRYLTRFERATKGGFAAYRTCRALAAEGFIPDVIFAFSGWGLAFFLKDAFPQAKLVIYNDLYYWARWSNYDFFPGRRPSVDRACRIQMSNSANLMDLADCDWCMVTTRWQLSSFPELFRSKISVIHDGIDVDAFSPRPGTTFTFPGVTLPPDAELVTYVTRGQEPYRGFEQFLRAVEQLQRRRPKLHAVIGGDDLNYYSFEPPDGTKKWGPYLRSQIPLDPARTHFTGPLPFDKMIECLRASHVHVYLTVPFLPSWSMFEAMASGCAIVASATPPVQELAANNEQALLVDFFDVDAQAERISWALDHQAELQPMRQAARRRIVERYALRDMLRRQATMLADVVAGKPPAEIEGWAPRLAGLDPLAAGR